MTLPPGFLDELRARVPLSRIVGRKVTWDLRKSNQAKGDWWAPCPFHGEKTASFHADDQKGFYYCFGCHAKGDAVTFLREAEGLGFMDAVAVMASEAGMQMPERSPENRARADRRTELAEVMERAARWFRLQLQTGAGAAARDYLAGRGLDQAGQDRFEIGFAPDQRQALLRHLKEGGASEGQVVDAGLAARPDDGGAAYDRFRGRIIFPIRDARGRCISFGGRAMDPNARAKYLNGPETALFDKGRNLYNLGPARAAVAKGQPLVVAEGYMDVIALVRAGIEGAVAPLGTAITEDNLAEYVAGLVVTNDVSARDVQLPQTQFYEAKSYPTFTPVGPWLTLVNASDLARLDSLRLTLSVNGQVRQVSTAADMIVRPARALTLLSRFQPMAPGVASTTRRRGEPVRIDGVVATPLPRVGHGMEAPTGQVVLQLDLTWRGQPVLLSLRGATTTPSKELS